MASEGEAVSRNASKLGERLKRDGKERVESSKRSVADHIREIAQALERAREYLDQTEPRLGTYAGEAATRVSNFATRLRDSDLDDLLAETRRVARRNPALYLAGAVGVGFVLARFLKSSAERSAALEYATGEYGSSTYPSDEYSGGEYASSGGMQQYSARSSSETTQDLDSRSTSEAVGTPGRTPTEGM